MKKIQIFQSAGNLVAAGIMAFFSVPKLLGLEIGKEGFEQFKTLVPLDPDVFRIFTGTMEISTVALLVAYTVTDEDELGETAYALLSSSMVGALTMEFFGRPKPNVNLVVIATALLALSAYRLDTLFAGRVADSAQSGG